MKNPEPEEHCYILFNRFFENFYLKEGFQITYARSITQIKLKYIHRLLKTIMKKTLVTFDFIKLEVRFEIIKRKSTISNSKLIIIREKYANKKHLKFFEISQNLLIYGVSYNIIKYLLLH